MLHEFCACFQHFADTFAEMSPLRYANGDMQFTQSYREIEIHVYAQGACMLAGIGSIDINLT